VLPVRAGVASEGGWQSDDWVRGFRALNQCLPCTTSTRNWSYKLWRLAVEKSQRLLFNYFGGRGVVQALIVPFYSHSIILPCQPVNSPKLTLATSERARRRRRFGHFPNIPIFSPSVS
jgi:hypothetical protein